MSQGFIEGFLSTDSGEAVASLIEIVKIDNQIKDYEDKLYSLKNELNRLQ